MKSEKEIVEDRDNAILTCRKLVSDYYFVFDTETTGITADALIIQFCVLESNGNQICSLVKPNGKISKEASEINGIIDEDVENAPSILELLDKIPLFVPMVIYNAGFDTQILTNSIRASGKGTTFYIDKFNEIYDAMFLYSAFKGEYFDGSYRYKHTSLEKACRQCGIEIDLILHDAAADAIMTDRLIRYIASQKLSNERE